MGDASNMSDLDKFLQCEEGKAYLEEIWQMLVGKTVTDVSFSNETWCVATTLHLDNGETFVVFQPSLAIEAIREEFAKALEAETRKDSPERDQR